MLTKFDLRDVFTQDSFDQLYKGRVLSDQAKILMKVRKIKIS